MSRKVKGGAFGKQRRETDQKQHNKLFFYHLMKDVDAFLAK